MPGRSLADTCVDCKNAAPSVSVRKRDLCQNCFIRYVNSKVMKRMERYRQKVTPKDMRRKLLLPLSFGVSSLTLLHILSQQLDRQNPGGRGQTAYDVHVLNIEGTTTGNAELSGRSALEFIREAYPRHTYSGIPLHSMFSYDKDIKDVMSTFGNSEFIDNPSKTDQERLDAFKHSLSTATSRADINAVLLTRLIVAFAKDNGCEGILWGDSDSRLAAKAIANVAKGRGSSLPWEICDIASPWGVQFNFPLRDLFKHELDLYISIVLPNLLPVVVENPKAVENLSNKNMSIEDLMSHYVATQGEKYPGVMANIVRTIDKLQAPSLEDAGSKCTMCGMPVVANTLESSSALDETISWGNEHAGKKPFTCYACARSCSDIKSLTPVSKS
ncbi:hypothetical protein AJ80_03918 [Polytolypa hystricis UAMH7299]|uniref:Cytoplasmic tRNA 2-thiolation protein 2 n=1 Tax=Polytolypa hystricis (strain UAMH7299) TaxID=1447883 RepID=A0A2B7YEU3_POLH7|nr:hypothetical protein AJ80_03918 [Polytolypa hystricis UAMH7299]